MPYFLKRMRNMSVRHTLTAFFHGSDIMFSLIFFMRHALKRAVILIKIHLPS